MRKLFIAVASLMLGALTLSAQSPNAAPPSDNGGHSGPAFTHRGAERQAWANLTPEQRGQIHTLLKQQHEEQKACHANGSAASCDALWQKQRTDRQNLAQSLGLKHLPFGGRPHRRGHRPQGAGQAKPGTSQPS